MNLDKQVTAIANHICHLLIIRGEGYTIPSYRWVEISLVSTKRQLTNMNVIQAILGNLIQGGFLELNGNKVLQRIEVSKSNFKKVSSIKGQSNSMNSLGYTPIYGLAKLDGTWRIGEQGDDLQGVGLGGTRSKLKSSWYWGDYDLNQNDVTYVDPGPNNDYPSIPQKAKEVLAKQLQTSNIREEQDIQIVRVHSRGSGASGEDYDYVICVSQ